MEKRDLLSPAEVARIIGVSRQQIYKWLNAGRIPYTRIGNYRFVARKDAKKPARAQPGPKPKPTKDRLKQGKRK